MNIHIVEPLKNFVKLQDKEWESGWWSLEESKAEALIGSQIYFHKNRMEPSFFGGVITGYRVEEDEQYRGRIVFTFRFSAECRNVETDKNGWSKKMKINSN
jgi:hypothetical protein